MKAITILIMSLVLLLGGNQWVTAGAVGYDLKNQIVRLSIDPGEEYPTKDDIKFYCRAGWTYEIILWVDQKDDSYLPKLVAEGKCEAIKPPKDKRGIGV